MKFTRDLIVMNKNISLKGGRVAVCAIFKDECTHVLEWLSHHRLVGINDFYIADNISSDGTSQLLEALHNDKVLTRLVWPTIPGTKPQLSAYEKLAELAKNDGVDWVLFIDADEFVMLDDKYSNIQSFIHEITTRDSKIAGITINWSTYGSSNLIINPDNEVLCNFEFRFKKDSVINRHYKSMIKLDAFISPGNPDVFSEIDLCENERCGFSIQCDVIENESLDFISVYYGKIATGCVNHNMK